MAETSDYMTPMDPQEAKSVCDSVMEAMYGGLYGDGERRIPCMLVGLSLRPGIELDDSENMRVIMPASMRPYLQKPEIREKFIGLMSSFIRNFGKHPEDQGPIAPGVRGG